MSNMLPVEHRRKIVRTFYMRIVLATAVAATGLGLITIASLSPSYLSLRFAAQSITHPSAAAEASTTVTAAVLETRDLIALAVPVATSSASAVDLMRLAISLRPASVTLDSIGYIRGVASGQILINGSAQRVSDIEGYRAALAGSGRFTQVSVPVNSLAGTTNGRFSITLQSKL